MRHEKKKQIILDKQISKVNGEFGESKMRLQKKIDDLQSHRRQLNDENEEENDAYQDDFIDEKYIDRMKELITIVTEVRNQIRYIVNTY